MLNLDFIFHRPADVPEAPTLSVGSQLIRVVFVRNVRARRYILRLRPDGAARITIPRRGSATEALRFAEANKSWLDQQIRRLAERPVRPKAWTVGTEILFRGERVRIEAEPNQQNAVRLGTEHIPVTDPGGDLRPVISEHLRRIAVRELPPRVVELASLHQAPVRRISVRNQRSRWGSCSRRATISLNWRLVQSPALVRDYIILHELSHLREMNHSPRFWAEVKRVCPDYELAEAWLKQNSGLLR